jgi:hypothetical protein
MSDRKLKSIFVIGTRLWSKRLADQLASSDRFNCVETYDLSVKSIWKLIKIFKYDYMIRVGVRPGMTRPRGVLVDACCYLAALFGAKIVVYWIGTDVDKTLHVFREAGSGYLQFWLRHSENYHHIAGAPWLSEELSEIGLKADTLYFPSPLRVPEHIPPFPDRFAVLSYVPDSRHEYYGSAEIYECAKQNPSIEFNIIAGSGTWVSEPLPNLHFHGWVNNIEDYYASAVVVVRLVVHDALGATVREGWINGRYVIYSYKLDNVLYVRNDDSHALGSVLQQLEMRFNNGQLTLNESGHRYALLNFEPVILTSRFIDKCLSSRSS